MEVIAIVLGIPLAILGFWAVLGFWGGFVSLFLGIPKLFNDRTRQEGKEVISGGLTGFGLSLLWFVVTYLVFTYLT